MFNVGCKILKILIYILSTILIASCTTANDKSYQTNNKFDTLPLPLDSTVFYFKTKYDRQDTAQNAIDTFVNSWYSYMLFALKEPILKDYKGEREVYRFTWLRSFNHPVVIRLEKRGDVIELFSKVSDGAGGYRSGIVIYDTMFHLKKKQVDTMNLKLNTANFWTLQTESRDNNGKDGSEWIVEVCKDRKYHMAMRWTPEKGTAFRAIGEYLLSVSLIKNETGGQDDY